MAEEGERFIFDAACIVDTNYLDLCCREYLGAAFSSRASIVADLENSFRCLFYRLHYVPSLQSATSVSGAMGLARYHGFPNNNTESPSVSDIAAHVVAESSDQRCNTIIIIAEPHHYLNSAICIARRQGVAVHFCCCPTSKYRSLLLRSPALTHPLLPILLRSKEKLRNPNASIYSSPKRAASRSFISERPFVASRFSHLPRSGIGSKQLGEEEALLGVLPAMYYLDDVRHALAQQDAERLRAKYSRWENGRPREDFSHGHFAGLGATGPGGGARYGVRMTPGSRTHYYNPHVHGPMWGWEHEHVGMKRRGEWAEWVATHSVGQENSGSTWHRSSTQGSKTEARARAHFRSHESADNAAPVGSEISSREERKDASSQTPERPSWNPLPSQLGEWAHREEGFDRSHTVIMPERQAFRVHGRGEATKGGDHGEDAQTRGDLSMLRALERVNAIPSPPPATSEDFMREAYRESPSQIDIMRSSELSPFGDHNEDKQLLKKLKQQEALAFAVEQEEREEEATSMWLAAARWRLADDELEGGAVNDSGFGAEGLSLLLSPPPRPKAEPLRDLDHEHVPKHRHDESKINLGGGFLSSRIVAASSPSGSLISSETDKDAIVIAAKTIALRGQMEEWVDKNSWYMFRHNTYEDSIYLLPKATATTLNTDSVCKYPNLLTEDITRVLRLNDQYLSALRRCIQLIASSWGWDIDMEAPLKFPHAKQRWDHWPVRLCYARITCRLLGLYSYSRSLAMFAEHLSGKGEDLSFYPPPCLLGLLLPSYGSKRVTLQRVWDITDSSPLA